MKADLPPTGLIRTLPAIYADLTSSAGRGFAMSLAAMETDEEACFFIALAQKPKVELLHLYVLIGGRIRVRCNLAGYESGDSRRCWDGTTRQPAVWAVCCGPVSLPSSPILMRGFQGFRYTSDLW